MPAYVPRRGDLVWLDFDPQAGHEQRGRRPALVLCPESYNRKVGLFLACPITNREKGYTFEVHLPAAMGVGGVILADQVRSMDWKTTAASFIRVAPQEVTQEVLGKLHALLDPEA